MNRNRLRFATLAFVGSLLIAACAPAGARDAQVAPTSAANRESTSRAAAPGPAPAAAPAQAPAGGQAAGNGGSQVFPELNRKVIYTASLTIQAQDVAQTQAETERIAREAGGYVAGSTLRSENDRPIATITLKVPADAYSETMGRLRALAVKVDSENATTQDVTEEYADLQAQLRNLEATEQQYLRLLERAGTIEEILKVQQQLSQTRGQIERVKGRLQFMDRRTEFSTITLTIMPVAATVRPVSGWDLGFVVNRAWNASLQFWRAIAEIAITLVIFGWWLLIPAGAVVWFVRHRRASRSTPATTGA